MATESGWTQERIDLIKRSICPKGISDDEFALFIEKCKRSGLDPLLNEAFCVPRNINVGTKERQSWIKKHEFQPSEAGMLARAERFPDYQGCTAGHVRESDACEIDQGAGTVAHKFNPAKRSGKVLGAWALVQRAGKAPVVVWLDLAGYVQTTPLWQKIPATMIEKCARVAALRKAYPSAFGGLYIKEEMPAEDAAEERAAPALPATTSATVANEALKEQLRANIRAKEQTVEAQAMPPGPTVAFGSAKGKSIKEIGTSALADILEEGTGYLSQGPAAKYAKPLKRNLEEIQRELESRFETELSDEPPADEHPEAA